MDGWMDGWMDGYKANVSMGNTIVSFSTFATHTCNHGSWDLFPLLKCVSALQTHTHTHFVQGARSLARSWHSIVHVHTTVCVCVCVCVSLSLSLSPSNYSRGDEESHCHVAHVMTLTAMLLFLPLCVSSLLSPRCTCGMVVCCISF